MKRMKTVQAIADLRNDFGISQVYKWEMYEDIQIGHFYMEAIIVSSIVLEHIKKNIGSIVGICAEDKNIFRVCFRYEQ